LIVAKGGKPLFIATQCVPEWVVTKTPVCRTPAKRLVRHTARTLIEALYGKPELATVQRVPLSVERKTLAEVPAKRYVPPASWGKAVRDQTQVFVKPILVQLVPPFVERKTPPPVHKEIHPVSNETVDRPAGQPRVDLNPLIGFNMWRPVRRFILLATEAEEAKREESEDRCHESEPEREILHFRVLSIRGSRQGRASQDCPKAAVIEPCCVFARLRWKKNGRNDRRTTTGKADWTRPPPRAVAPPFALKNKNAAGHCQHAKSVSPGP